MLTCLICLRKMPNAVSRYRTWGPTLGREGQEGQLWLHSLQGPFILSTLARNFPTPILYHHLLYLYWGRDILYSSSAYTEVNGITHILLESLKNMWLVGISGESPTGCYCHPGQLISFSGIFFFFFRAKKPQLFCPSLGGPVSSCPSPSCSVKSSYFSCVILEFFMYRHPKKQCFDHLKANSPTA